MFDTHLEDFYLVTHKNYETLRENTLKTTELVSAEARARTLIIFHHNATDHFWIHIWS